MVGALSVRSIWYLGVLAIPNRGYPNFIVNMVMRVQMMTELDTVSAREGTTSIEDFLLV